MRKAPLLTAEAVKRLYSGRGAAGRLPEILLQPLSARHLCAVRNPQLHPGALLAHNRLLYFLPEQKTESSLWRLTLVIVSNPSTAGKEVVR